MNAAVGVWWVATSAAPPDAALLPLLDARERARLASYQEPWAARMFAVGAALVRCLAARELGSSPSDVQPTTLSLRVDGDAVDVSTAGRTPQRLGLRRLACRPGSVSSLASPTPVSVLEHDAAGLLDDARHCAASA